MSELPTILPPKIRIHPRLLVILRVNDWEANYADQVWFHALSPSGRRILRALTRNSRPVNSGTAEVNDLARRFGYSNTELDQLTIALTTFVGATMASFGHGTMTVHGRDLAREIVPEHVVASAAGSALTCGRAMMDCKWT